MTTLSRRIVAAAALGLPLIATGSGLIRAQTTPGDKAVVGIWAETSYSGDARITAVDMPSRMVTLAFADGRSTTLKVSDAVQNLGQVKAGDQLTVRFRERRSFVLSGPDARTPADRDVAAARRAAPGQSPAALLANQSVVNWWIVSTDLARNTISLVSPGSGEVRTFDVTSPEGRQQLPRAKPGDNLTVIQTEILVIAITPKA